MCVIQTVIFIGVEIHVTSRTAVSPTLDLLYKEDFNIGQSEAESNTEIFLAQ